MLKFLALYILVGFFFEESVSIDRDAVRSEYEPVLSAKSEMFLNFSQELSTSISKLKFENADVTLSNVGSFEHMLMSLQGTITNVKRSLAPYPDRVNCVEMLEEMAHNLTTKEIITNCLLKFDYSKLEPYIESLITLSTIPKNTLSACTELYPLPSQDELFYNCVLGQVKGFNSDAQFVQSVFLSAKSQTMADYNSCMSQNTASLGQQISKIGAEVKAC